MVAPPRSQLRINKFRLLNKINKWATLQKDCEQGIVRPKNTTGSQMASLDAHLRKCATSLGSVGLESNRFSCKYSIPWWGKRNLIRFKYFQLLSSYLLNLHFCGGGGEGEFWYYIAASP
jgi:hypothetical protein